MKPHGGEDEEKLNEHSSKGEDAANENWKNRLHVPRLWWYLAWNLIRSHLARVNTNWWNTSARPEHPKWQGSSITKQTRACKGSHIAINSRKNITCLEQQSSTTETSQTHQMQSSILLHYPMHANSSPGEWWHPSWSQNMIPQILGAPIFQTTSGTMRWTFQMALHRMISGPRWTCSAHRKLQKQCQGSGMQSSGCWSSSRCLETSSKDCAHQKHITAIVSKHPTLMATQAYSIKIWTGNADIASWETRNYISTFKHLEFLHRAPGIYTLHDGTQAMQNDKDLIWIVQSLETGDDFTDIQLTSPKALIKLPFNCWQT